MMWLLVEIATILLVAVIIGVKLILENRERKLTKTGSNNFDEFDRRVEEIIKSKKPGHPMVIEISEEIP